VRACDFPVTDSKNQPLTLAQLLTDPINNKVPKHLLLQELTKDAKEPILIGIWMAAEWAIRSRFLIRMKRAFPNIRINKVHLSGCGPRFYLYHEARLFSR
jgi:hypothetical protein